jgi:hypothetical protein
MDNERPGTPLQWLRRRPRRTWDAAKHWLAPGEALHAERPTEPPRTTVPVRPDAATDRTDLDVR